MPGIDGLQPSEKEGALRLLSEARVCRLGCSDNGKPYVLPMNFVFAENTLFLHSGPEKSKIAILRLNPRVCVQIDEIKEMVRGGNPCGFSYSFVSLLVHGEAAFETSVPEKNAALVHFARKYAGTEYSFTEKQIAGVAVIKIPVASITVKIKKRQD
ncbi:MAG: pyridoxamine 5'-phosphate oxidase family protein [Spirochaetales bacterium]|nr:MAG: pyridoxamine 5'-phosphate oxidase family protein [Spirochaetales bacterium]